MLVSYNPATGRCIDSLRVSTQESIHASIAVAKQASIAWRKTSFDVRCDYLKKFAKRLSDHEDSLATLISKENGKPLWESRTEVTGSIRKIQYSIDAYQDRVMSQSFSQKGSAMHGLSYKPLGVVAVISPFNFPCFLLLGHVIPALLAGNTVLVKPSEFTPLVALTIIRYLWESGIPADVIHCVIGGAKQGHTLVSHPNIDGILFTGGYLTAQAISTSIATMPEKLFAMECGGNNPLVIHSFSNEEKTIDCIINSSFLTSGQRCTCTRRLIVVRSQDSQSLVDSVCKKVESLSIGPYTMAPEPFLGPLISQQAMQQGMARYQQLCDLGAVSLVPMRKLGKTGFFVSPGIVDISAVVDTVDDTECFGPLLQVIMVDSLEEAIDRANATSYGLSASIISESENVFLNFFQDVKAGVINWNKPTNGASSVLPFGGVGRSGNFRPAGYFAIDSCVYPVASVRACQLE